MNSASAPSQSEATRPVVLILGAGINGAAVARELALNGVDVCLVDANDIAYGATSRSSRLIHGGLRYLEYGDFALVRESLVERARLLKTAPQFVQPLRLYIPVSRRTGGFVHSALRFLRLSRTRLGRGIGSLLPASRGRGLWIVRVGLWFYDWLARGGDLPEHEAFAVPMEKCSTKSTAGARQECSSTLPNGLQSNSTQTLPQVNRQTFRWLCAYSDAQIIYPERFVLAMLEDARRAAKAHGTRFEIYTHSRVELKHHQAVVCKAGNAEAAAVFEPTVIVNATGAWGDATLSQLNIPSERLFGGTKGSHFYSRRRELRQAIGNNAVYAEADDGRLVFILPFLEGTLVGTTDERFEADPGTAVATDDEISYLLEMVREVLPHVELTRQDVDMHYCGVRPLPYSGIGKESAVPRGHWIARNDQGPAPVYTLIGGKLTTCRSLGEEVADLIFRQLGVARQTGTQSRALPGAESYPKSVTECTRRQQELAHRFSLTLEQVRSIWQLCGTRTAEILDDLNGQDHTNLSDVDLPRSFVRWAIDNEWATTLEDLVERRLMLLYDVGLTACCLRELASCLVDAGCLLPAEVDQAVQTECHRLATMYGKMVDDAVTHESDDE